MNFSPGTSLGRYKVLSLLGEGGMGEVYLSLDTRLNRQVALKVLPADLINNREPLHRFEQEAQAASALNHPNIITIHEIGTEGDTHFIATEFIEGETLRRKLQTTRLEIAETLNIVTQIAAALGAAHRSGIVHRDIKPENVMVREDGLVKVLDFGLAKLTEKKDSSPADVGASTLTLIQTTPGLVMGTVAYMSPEQARGLEVDARTDIFSLGIVLYEMLTGGLPFAGETISDRIASILTTEPAPLSQSSSDVPKELERIVGRTLRKNRDERYQHIKDLLIDLRDLKQDMEFEAKLERSTGSTKAIPDKAASVSKIQSAQTASGVKYLADEIKNHKVVAIAALLVLTVGIAALYYFTRGIVSNKQTNTETIDSIAVLPFANATKDPNVEYLSDGISESLINRLSQLTGLKVMSSSSVFRYKGREQDAQKVGNDLNVRAVLTGSVKQIGDQLVINVSLDDVHDNHRIWGEQYVRKFADVFAVQSEIAQEVSSNLRLKLTSADQRQLAKRYTENAEAYQLYLKGRFYWNKRTPRDLQKSIDYFEKAIGVDPNYALAFAGLADAYALLSSYLAAPPREAMPKAREAALKSLSLDDQLVEAHAALGLILNTYNYDFAGAEHEFKRAIDLNSNYATAHQYYGELLMYLDRREAASAEFQRALELDPLSLITSRIYGESMLYARKYDAAIAQFKKTIELDANFATVHVSLSLAYQLKGEYRETIEEFAKFQELVGEPENAAVIRQSFARGGWQGFLRKMTGERRLSNATPYAVATWFAQLGEKDKAFAELNKAYENREYNIVLLKVDPRFDDLRSDSRFQDLLRRVGFMP
ncbi:MAG: protein kinase [Pyrinomonadaceae bacterium]